MTLFERLKQNKKIPMHTPGHKRNESFEYLRGMAKLDITETEGFDNLHSPTGILLQSMENAARKRGARAAFYLVNGSTCGILASVCAVLNEGDKVIMARNCHKSVYNGIELSGARQIFVYPEYNDKYGISGAINPADISEKIKENPDTKLVIITSPTYEGVISDIGEICAIAHEKNIPVMVDAAHGAHLGFSGFCKDAVSLGADISVESLHKTLPSLTQTAICYLSGELVSAEKVSERLSVFETSSPSYLLLSSIDGCINEIYKNDIFSSWNENLDCFYDRSQNLENIEIIRDGDGFFDFDRSKVVIFPKNQSGTELASVLRQENIEPEMVTPFYVICMTGAGDTKKSFEKLAEALEKADKKKGKAVAVSGVSGFSKKSVMTIKNALKSDKVFCDINAAEGKISAGYVWAYPPGVPIIVPGEEISAEITEKIVQYGKNGIELLGNIKNNKILVVK